MTGSEAVWSASLVAAAVLIPVGTLRMLAYRSGEVDHTPGMRFVAWLALGLGGAALLVWLAMTAACGSGCMPG